jgi:nucleotide-binding universal stress UspA family protein
MSESAQPRSIVGIADAQPATMRFAVDEASRLGLDLEVVHCAGYANYARRAIDHLYFENWLEAAENVLVDARVSVEREFDPPRARYRMSDVPPVDELLACSGDAAQIVVGSDDPTWFSRMLSPAVSQTVARAARCPVVVVPELAAPTAPPTGVVVAIEGSHPEDHVLRYAFEYADHRACRLTVLHALPVNAWAGEREAHGAAIAEALAGWGDKFPDVAVTRKLVAGEPYKVCARATRHAELVVVGQPRQSPITFGIDNPTTHALLARANGPVAVVPDPLAWRPSVST